LLEANPITDDCWQTEAWAMPLRRLGEPDGFSHCDYNELKWFNVLRKSFREDGSLGPGIPKRHAVKKKVIYF
jgi:hypothetical protein